MNTEAPRNETGENISETVKLEVTVKPYKTDKKDREQEFDEKKDLIKEHEHEKDKEIECNKDFDEYKYDEKLRTLAVCVDEYCKSCVINVNSCDDLVCYDLGDYFFNQNGCILELSIKLKDVCPQRRTALALILYELDHCGKEHIRGFKTVLLPPTGRCVCEDICVKCLRFVIPDALDVSGGCNPCGSRKFVVRFTANYVDSDFSVCGCLVPEKDPAKD